MKRAFLFLFLVVFGAAGAHAQGNDAAGHWEGAIQLPGQKLEVLVDLARAKGSWSGKISIPAQGARDLALDAVRVDGANVTFKIPKIPGDPTFAGKIAGGALAGTFTQGGQSVPFELKRERPPADNARAALEGMDATIEKIRADFKAPGLAVAVVVGDEPVYLKGFGLRDVERKLPVTPDTLFAIGSCTKAFTTFMLGTLVEEGKLDWDKPVRTWIPWLKLVDPMASERLTPRDMVTHRSGLPRHDGVWYNARMSRREVVRRLAFLEPSKDFRTTFQYNNLMFIAAGFLAEEITGKTWEELVKARVFAPLGMKRANVGVEVSKKDADHAEPYREEKDGTVTHIPFRNIDLAGPAGSINASVRDMVPWLSVHLDDGRWKGKQLLSAGGMSNLHLPVTPLGDRGTDDTLPIGYALGWGVQVYRGVELVEHDGGIDGMTAKVVLAPKQRLGIVILANQDGSPVPGLVEQTIIDRVAGLEPKDWAAELLEKRNKGKVALREAEERKKGTRRSGTSPAHAIDEYVGEYENPGYGVVRVDKAANGLKMTYNFIEAPLEHWHYEVWNVGRNEKDPVFEDTKVLFVGDYDGEVSAVQASLEPAVKDIVFARKPEARLFDPAFLKTLTGAYALTTEEVNIVLRGTKLFAVLKGQPEYELVPVRGTKFELKDLSGYRVTFRGDEAVFDQPNGTFVAKRKK